MPFSCDEQGRPVPAVLIARSPDQRVTLGLHRRQVIEDDLQATELTAKLRLQPGRQRPAVAGDQIVEAGAIVGVERSEARDALAGQQPLDPVGVANALAQQLLALPAKTAKILFLPAGRAYHRADAALAPTPSHQRAQQGLNVDGIGLAPTLAAVDGDRGGDDDMARDAMGDEQPVQPKAVEPGLLHGDDRNRRTGPLLDPASQVLQQNDEPRAIAGIQRTFRDPGIAGRTRGDEP